MTVQAEGQVSRGPESGVCLVSLRKCKKASVAGPGGENKRRVEDEATEDLEGRVGKALLVIVTTSSFPFREKMPGEGSDQRRDLFAFGVTGSFWLLCCQQTEVGQRWAQEDQSEAGAVSQVRDDGSSDQEGSSGGGETQDTVWR